MGENSGSKKKGDGTGADTQTKKGGGFWDALRTVGAGVLEGLSGGETIGGAGSRPRTPSRQDPVLTNERPAAAKQIHRSMKAWRDRQDAEASDGSEQEALTEQPGKEQAPQIGTKLEGARIHRAGNKPLTGDKKDKMGTGPEANAVRVGNAVQAGVQAPPQHHVLPQEHSKWFADHGLNVHDYCVTLEKDHHDAVHARPSKKDAGAKGFDEAKQWEWSTKLMAELNKAEKLNKKKLTSDEVLKVVRQLMPAYGL